jgi:hypothetical protein
MTIPGEAARPEAALQVDEIVKFANDVVWAGVNHYFGSDFRETAKAGEDIKFNRRFVGEEGELPTRRYKVEAFCWMDYENSTEEPEKRHGVKISAEELRADMTDCMMEASLTGLDKTFAEVYMNDPDDDEETLQAWEVVDYYFEGSKEPVEVDKGFEIQDDDGDVFWDDGALAGNDSQGATLTDEEKRLANELDDGVMSIFTGQDCARIAFALLELGVPAEIVSRTESF